MQFICLHIGLCIDGYMIKFYTSQKFIILVILNMLQIAITIIIIIILFRRTYYLSMDFMLNLLVITSKVCTIVIFVIVNLQTIFCT